MREGKVALTVLKRSILKNITPRSPQVLLGADIGNDFSCCAAISHRNDGVFILSSSHACAAPEEWAVTGAFYRCANDLYTAYSIGGVTLLGARLDILLPPETEEAALRQLIRSADNAAEQLGIEIMGGHTTVTSAVQKPVLSAALIASVCRNGAEGAHECRPEDVRLDNKAQPGQDIVITKWIGMEGTAYLAHRYAERLESHYRSEFLDNARDFMHYLTIKGEAAVAGKHGVKAMHNLSEGGVFGGLWELAERSGVGLDADLKKIPIRQETVELCEFCGRNPYQLLSGGALLLAADDGQHLVRELEAAGIPAAVIGMFTEGKDRILRNDEEIRYLDLPQKDDILKENENER